MVTAARRDLPALGITLLVPSHSGFADMVDGIRGSQALPGTLIGGLDLPRPSLRRA
jgi:hypothetical protein